MARVLVTGGAGFIGSALVRRLARAGDEVVVLDRPEADLFRLAPVADQVEVLPCDLFDSATWLPQVREFAPERVFHFAWYAEPGKYLTSPLNLDHLRCGIEFTRAILALRPRHFVIAGTCYEYRMAANDSDDAAPLHEDATPEHPDHLYSACKLALKQVALQLARDAGLPLTWARVFYLWGPYEHPKRLVPFLVNSLRAGKPVELRSHGRQLRDFVHVDDVASGIDHAAHLPQPGVVNIGSGKAISVRDLAYAIADIFDRRDLVSFAPDDTHLDEPMVVEASSDKLRSLGWAPRHTFDLASINETDE